MIVVLYSDDLYDNNFDNVLFRFLQKSFILLFCLYLAILKNSITLLICLGWLASVVVRVWDL